MKLTVVEWEFDIPPDFPTWKAATRVEWLKGQNESPFLQFYVGTNNSVRFSAVDNAVKVRRGWIENDVVVEEIRWPV